MKQLTPMSSNRQQVLRRVSLLAIVTILILSAAFLVQVNLAKASGPAVTQVSVFATGLDNPRGLAFGPDGDLYVAEGGRGGTDSTTAEQCAQVIPPIGPYTSGMTARISKVSPTGERSTVVDGLPSDQTSPDSGGLISGVADVAFVRGRLYAVLAGAGCSHGVADVPNGVIAVRPDGTWHMVADLSAFQQANPVQNPEADDFEPDGTWYSMIAAKGGLYAVEPNHGELDQIALNGKVRRVIDISASQGHIVPTTLDYYKGHFYVGNLETFPLAQGAAKVMEINRGGRILSQIGGLTNVLAAVHDASGNLYVLESTTGNDFPTPGTGQVLRINTDGSRETIVTGLSLPTAMIFGPDGALYISNQGFGFPAGMGQIVRVELGS